MPYREKEKRKTPSLPAEWRPMRKRRRYNNEKNGSRNNFLLKEMKQGGDAAFLKKKRGTKSSQIEYENYVELEQECLKRLRFLAISISSIESPLQRRVTTTS